MKKLQRPLFPAFCQSNGFITLLVFAASLLISRIFLPCSLKSLESNGLFLFTPDYRQMVSQQTLAPLHFALNYLTQFFYYSWAGPAAVALAASLLYFIPSLFIRKKPARIILAGLLPLALLIFALLPQTRSSEQWARLEFAAEEGRWTTVLDIATPDAASREPQMIPYALLALAQTNQLPQRMLEYPVHSLKDMDPEGDISYKAYLFKSIFYNCLGQPNEALHNNFQAACFLPYGTSAGTLRRAVLLYSQLGDSALCHKYAAILAHSTLHRSWAAKYPAPSGSPFTAAKPNATGANPVINKNLCINLSSIMDDGTLSPALCDYLLCSLLLSRNLPLFQQALQQTQKLFPRPLPPLFSDASRLYGSLLSQNSSQQPSARPEASPYSRYFYSR